MRISGLVVVPAGTCRERAETEGDAEKRAGVLMGEAAGKGIPVFPAAIQEHLSFGACPREEPNRASGECVLTSYRYISESYTFAR